MYTRLLLSIQIYINYLGLYYIIFYVFLQNLLIPETIFLSPFLLECKIYEIIVTPKRTVHYA